MTTVTKTFSPRLGTDYWVVTWGKGLTQTRICLTEAEAVAVANQPNPGIRQGSVEPQDSLR